MLICNTQFKLISFLISIYFDKQIRLNNRSSESSPYQRGNHLDSRYTLIEMSNCNNTGIMCEQIVSICKSTDIVHRIIILYYSRVDLLLIATISTFAVAYLVRHISSAPIIARFDVAM